MLLGLLMNTTRQACGEGCLSCTEDVETGTISCNICDIFRSYVKKFDGTCELKEIENCEVASLNHFSSPCLQCKPNYVLDIVQGKCVSVNFSKIVPDCYRYSNLSTCLSCNPDHYIEIGKCIKSETLLEGCIFYSSDGICSECEMDKFLDKDINECREFPKATSCSVYNNLRCDQCKVGYAQDLNFYLRFTPSDSNIESFAVNQANYSQVSQSKDENCFPLNVPNCKVHETADTCLECESDYFVTVDRKCEAYPQNRINNCKVYSDKTTCQECEILYKLESNKCVRRSLLPHCARYVANTDACAECVAGKALLSGSCTTRVKSTANCQKLKAEDGCEECAEGYLRNDLLECFPKIEYCESHVSAGSDRGKCDGCDSDHFLPAGTPAMSCTEKEHQPYCITPTTNANTCNACATGYYLTGGKCHAYTIDFCNQFNPNEDKCLSCIDGFKFDSGLCKIIELNNCLVPSTTEGECTTCVPGFYKDSGSICRVRNLVGCETPTADANTCTTCIDGYKKESDNLCYQIIIENCPTANITKAGCSSCDNGYTVNQYKTCSKEMSNTDGCKSGQITDGVCTECETTHYHEPISKYCIARNNTTGCTAYETNADFCTDCDNDKFLLGGKCVTRTVTCTQYVNKKNECSECPADKYLDPFTKNCLPNIMDNCTTPGASFSFGCSVCADGYYLNPQTKLCEIGFISHCATYSKTTLECTVCEANSYLLGGRCYKKYGFGCKTYSTTTPLPSAVCTACYRGFYLDSGECKISNIANCKTYNAAGTGCTTCIDGYYPKTANECLKQHKAHCLEYTVNTNDCTKCENLFFTSSNDCAQLTKTNCRESGGVDDECLVCMPGYKLNTNACTAVSDNHIPIKHCYGKNQDDDEYCDICEFNFKPLIADRIIQKIPTGCAVVDATNPYKCSQCAEYFEPDPNSATNNNSGLCLPATDTTCIQVQAGEFQTLANASTAGKCAKCANNDTHYNNNGTCTERSTITHCGEYDTAADTCATCKYPYNKLVKYIGESTCADLTFSKITNCSIYSTTPDTSAETCLVCDAGFQGATCASANKNTFPMKLWGLDWSSATVVTANHFTSHTMGITSAGAKVLGGAAPATNKIPGLAKDTIQYSNYNNSSAQFEYNVFHFLGEQTIANTGTAATWAKTTIIAECNFLLQDIDDKNYCVVCNSGKIGITENLTTSVTETSGSPPVTTTTTNNYTIVKSCVDVTNTNLAKNYTGMGYLGHDVLTGLNTTLTDYMFYGSTVTYDSCTNDYIPFVYFIARSAPFSYLAPSTFYENDPTMKCIPKVNEVYEVENCQVYGYIGTDETEKPDPEFNIYHNIRCISCKPGYMGSNFGSGTSAIMPGKCSEIENCDMESSENTVMNACNKCKVGFGWEYDGTNLSVLMHKCISVPNKCKVYDPVTLECRICDLGYMKNANYECVPPSDVGCSIKGIEDLHFIGTTMSSLSGALKLSSIYTTYYLAKSLAADSNSMVCQSCGTSKIPTRLPTVPGASAAENLCSFAALTYSGCLKYEAGTTGNECVECGEGYVLDSTAKACKLLSNYYGLENCLETTTTNLTLATCVTCREPYYLNNSERCVENDHCTAVDSNRKCKACEENYYLDSQTDLCVEIPEGIDCAKLYNFGVGIQNSTCMVCKDRSLYPINTKNETTFGWKCVDYVPEYSSVFSLFLFNYAPSDTERPPSGSLYYDNAKIGNVGSSGGYFPSINICVPKSSERQNCAVFNPQNNTCATCLDGHYLDGAYCVKGDIDFCNKYADQYTCSECVETHYLDANATLSKPEIKSVICKPHEVDCGVYQKDQDLCVSCKPFHHFNSSTFACTAYTVLNCAVYFPTDDKCLLCDEGYFMSQDTEKQCDPITVENCATFSRQFDQCLTCRHGFYLDITQKCIPHTRMNCRLYSQFKDECELCEDGYYLDDVKNCKENFLVGCEIPKQNEQRCVKCLTGYWLNVDKKLCEPHTVQHCSLFDSKANKCLACDDASYMDSSTSKCVQYSAALNCETFHPKEDKCVSCLDGFYLDSSDKCLEYTILTCKTYNKTDNKCTSCHEGNYLDKTTHICKPITALNCEKYSVSENRCSLCPSSTYLDIGSGNCLFYSKQNCDKYHPYQDQCSTCVEGHYLSSTFNCMEYSAPGCASYSMSSDACISCDNGFYLNVFTQECLAYTAKNCVSYQLQADKCSSCLPGFYMNNGSCIIYTVSNCAKNDSVADRCIGCIPGYYFSAGKCLPYQQPNCKDYKSHIDRCLNCQPGYYFEFGRCFEYTAKNCKGFNENKDLCDQCDNSSGRIFRNDENQHCEEVTEVENCKTYKTDMDECVLCNDEFYLEDQECKPNPTGIPMCEIYANEEQCALCQAGAYLTNNTCVEPQVLINGCNRYSSENCCEECNGGFTLSSTFHCETTIETSCASHKDPYNCETCAPHKVLARNTDDNFVCEDSGIQFCAEAISVSGVNNCIKCEQGYFLNDSQTQCLWPETLVEHCLEYSGHGICSRCKDNYLLSKDNAKCTTDIALVGSQCLVGHISDKPKCARCEGGYYFDESGVCQKCSDEIEGCAICDIKNLSRCLICAKDFYMTDEFKCVEYPPIPPIDIGVDIVKYAVMSMMLLVMIIK